MEFWFSRLINSFSGVAKSQAKIRGTYGTFSMGFYVKSLERNGVQICTTFNFKEHVYDYYNKLMPLDK